MVKYIPRSSITIACALMLAGCAAVGPDYRAPMAQVESQWSAPLPHGMAAAARVLPRAAAAPPFLFPPGAACRHLPQIRPVPAGRTRPAG